VVVMMGGYSRQPTVDAVLAPVPPVLVSVVIPTFDRGHLLRRAIHSVRVQTMTSWELIVVDDASPNDDITAIVAEFGDPRIRCLRHDSNRGAPAARNIGIRASKGDYIAFLDSDDEWLPNKLEVQLARFDEMEARGAEVGVVVCNWMRVTQTPTGVREKALRRKPLVGDALAILLARRNMRPTSTILVKRIHLDEGHCFDESLASSQEWDLLVRLAECTRFECVEQYLVKLHHHDGARISSSQKRMRGMEDAIAKHHAELGTRPIASASHHATLALRYSSEERIDMKRARHHLRRAIAATPWSPRPYLWYAAAIRGPRTFRLIYKLTCFPTVMLDRRRRRRHGGVRTGVATARSA